MSRVEIPVEAKLNAGDIDAELKQLTQKINALGQSIASANKVKFNPIGKATLDDLKRINAEFEKIKRGQLGADINRTGQGGKSFVDLDWSTLATNSVAREARRMGAFNKVLGGTGASFTMPSAGPNSAPAPSTPTTRQRDTGGSGGSPWASAGRKIVGSGLKAAGPVGAAADEGLSAAATGGIAGGLVGFAGSLLATGIGKLVGGIMNKVGDAQNDMIGYDTLKRSLGDVNVSFNVLRDSMHKASDAFDGTYQQALRMGTEFARISGISGRAAESELPQEVAVSGGFGRSFGIDPEQSNTFFAQMRQFQITGNEKDSQRLALMIGEQVAKAGAFSKTDEVLQAIASYTSQQTRMGLASANVGDYSAMLTSMVGAHVPGMDPMGAASVLSRVNSAIQSGGNAGEAGQNFMYMAAGRQLNLDPIMAAALREQGAFGTGQREFGSGSVMARWASMNNVSIPAAAANSQATTMSLIMSRLHSTYANNPELRLSAMQNLFGIGINQAAFLDTLKPAQMGDVMSKLNGAGIDTSKMNPTAISSLAQVALGSHGDLSDATKQIWSRLSPDEQSNLNKAQAGGDESLRTQLLKDFAKYGQGETEGEQTRKSIQDLDKDMQDAAAKMISPLNVMRDTLLMAFGKRGNGVMTPDDIHKAVIEGQKKDINDQADERIKTARDAYTRLTVGLRGAPDEGLEKQIRAAADNMQSETGAANWERWSQLTQLDADNATPVNRSSPGASAALPNWAHGTDSGSSPFGRAYDPIGGAARNQRNNNPGNIEFGQWAQAHGATGSDGRFAIFPSAQVGAAAMNSLLSSYGSKDHLDTVTGIVGKWAPNGENNTSAYIANVAKQMGVDPNTHLNMSDPNVIQALGRAMSGFEGSSSAYQDGTPLPYIGPGAGGGASPLLDFWSRNRQKKEPANWRVFLCFKNDHT
jgi:hypothetical protein